MELPKLSESQKQLELQKKWYSNPSVQYQLIAQLQHRYLGFSTRNARFDPTKPISKTNKEYVMARYYIGYNQDQLLKSFNVLHIMNKQCKLYFDLAPVKYMHIFPYDAAQRKPLIQDYRKNKFKENAAGFDFGIDIDGDTLENSWKQAASIKQLFDNFKLPYSIKFSGKRGFHFYIPSAFHPRSIKVLNLPLYFYNISQNICSALKLNKDFIDTSIYNMHMLFKLAYSISDNNVCLPLDDEQFRKFNISDVSIESVLQKVKIFRRGLLVRMHDQLPAKLEKNWHSFIKQYRGKPSGEIHASSKEARWKHRKPKKSKVSGQETQEAQQKNTMPQLPPKETD